MRSKTEKRELFAAHPFSLAQNPQAPGQWRARYPNPSHPFVVELGTAKGAFLLGLAQRFPERNYLGIERKAERLYYIAKEAASLGLTNLWLLREDVYVIREVFAAQEIDQLWITFPDPYPKDRHEKHRMTGPYFLDQYRQVLAPTGWVDFKTDAADLFDYTLDVLDKEGITPERITRDLHQSAELDDENGILTGYEQKFMAQGLPIHYMRFRFS